MVCACTREGEGGRAREGLCLSQGYLFEWISQGRHKAVSAILCAAQWPAAGNS